jgi:hypothetical protein
MIILLQSSAPSKKISQGDQAPMRFATAILLTGVTLTVWWGAVMVALNLARDVLIKHQSDSGHKDLGGKE